MKPLRSAAIWRANEFPKRTMSEGVRSQKPRPPGRKSSERKSLWGSEAARVAAFFFEVAGFPLGELLGTF